LGYGDWHTEKPDSTNTIYKRISVHKFGAGKTMFLKEVSYAQSIYKIIIQ